MSGARAGDGARRSGSRGRPGLRGAEHPGLRDSARGVTAARDLAGGARPAAHWRERTDTGDGPRAPRLAPDELIGRGVTRVGRFRRIDPLRTPRLWSRWHWVGVVFWAGVVGQAGRRAWRQHGGPRGAAGAVDGGGADEPGASRG